jgi:hypothetical protein
MCLFLPSISFHWFNKNFYSLNGSAIVARSVDLNEPVIYVSMNYRCVQLVPALSA